MPGERESREGGVQDGADPQGADERERVLRETREASLRAEGGGSSDEDDIRQAASGGRGAD